MKTQKLKFINQIILLTCCALLKMGFAQTLTTIKQVKSPNRNLILDSVKLQGYIVCDKIPLLISDISLYLRNSIIPEENYIQIEGKLANYIIENKQMLSGMQVEINGIIRQSDLKSLNPFDSLSASEIFIESNEINLKKLGKKKTGNTNFNGIKMDTSIIKSNNLINPCNKFALLYSGGINPVNAHPRYYNDLEFMYLTLKYKYGYSDENIIVVYKDGITVNSSKMHVDFAANSIGLENALIDVKNKIGFNGDLFLFVTNHGGGYSANESILAGGLNDANNDEVDNFKIDETIYYYKDYPNELTDDDFAHKIASLNLNTLVALLEPCFSGGFIRDLRANNRIIITAANEFEYSWSSSIGPYFDEFSYLFTSALNGAFHDGRSLDADSNHDGIMSIFEAYTYALTNDKQNEHPMIDDNGDGISDNQDGFFATSLSLKSCANFRIDNLKSEK